MNRALCICRRVAALGVLALSLAGLAAAQTLPNPTVPQKVPEAPQDHATDGTLSGQLDQTSGVIHPPAGVDRGSMQPTPPVGEHSTPVIPPPGSSGGEQNVNPK